MLEGVDGFLGVIVVLDVDLDFGSVSYCLEGGCFVFGVVDLDGQFCFVDFGGGGVGVFLVIGQLVGEVFDRGVEGGFECNFCGVFVCVVVMCCYWVLFWVGCLCGCVLFSICSFFWY